MWSAREARFLPPFAPATSRRQSVPGQLFAFMSAFEWAHFCSTSYSFYEYVNVRRFAKLIPYKIPSFVYLLLYLLRTLHYNGSSVGVYVCLAISLYKMYSHQVYLHSSRRYNIRVSLPFVMDPHHDTRRYRIARGGSELHIMLPNK